MSILRDKVQKSNNYWNALAKCSANLEGGTNTRVTLHTKRKTLHENGQQDSVQVQMQMQMQMQNISVHRTSRKKITIVRWIAHILEGLSCCWFCVMLSKIPDLKFRRILQADVDGTAALDDTEWFRTTLVGRPCDVGGLRRRPVQQMATSRQMMLPG